MDFTNINDPAGVSALLNSLRTSQAWADLQAKLQDHPPQTTSSSNEPAGAPEIPSQNIVEAKGEPNPTCQSVAGLLSQLSSSSQLGLQPSVSSSVQSNPKLPESNHLAAVKSNGEPAGANENVSLVSMKASRSVEQNLRTMSFQQALPVIANLSEDSAFVESVLQLRKDQDDLEQQLWDEREDLIMGQTEKVKVAVTKANMVGSGISEREANLMREGFVKQLDKFNQDRVLPAWDALMHRQQAKLEMLGVPTMHSTDSGADRHRQQRIVQVLEGITSVLDQEDAVMG